MLQAREGFSNGARRQRGVIDVPDGILHGTGTGFCPIPDEVHRYAITFHRDKRSKHALHSELDDIKGIGSKTAEALLKTFKSVKNIKGATYEQLATTIGPAKAKIVFEHFENQREQS